MVARTLIISTLGLLFLCGCPQPPPAEAVLQGTWELVPDTAPTPAITDWFLTFDDQGDLTQIRYTVAGFAQVTWTNPPGAVNVDGNNVFISATQSGSGLTFEGTLNDAQNVVDGTLSSNIVIGGLTITVSQGGATLTKQ